MRPKLEFERAVAVLSICTVITVALCLGLVAVSEYNGIPYTWPWTKIALSAVLLVGAALGMTLFAVKATNLLVPEVCRCNSTSSVDGICNDCGFKISE